MKKSPYQIEAQAGFTLIELIITTAIAAILVALAAPAFQEFIHQTRLTIATNALHEAMNLARMEAIKRNSRVDLIAHNGSWKNGWTIEAGGEQIIRHDALHSDITVSGTDNTKHFIAYNGAGRTRTNASNYAPLFGTIRMSTGKESRLLVLNFLGRVRVCNPAKAKNCIDSEQED